MSKTLLHYLEEHAARRPDDAAVIFIHEDSAREPITYAELLAHAHWFARALQARGIGPDDVVILVLGHTPALLSAFLGAMYAGAVPSIFAYLTEKLDPQIYRERVRALAVESGARAVITARGSSDALRALVAPDCAVIPVDELMPDTSPRGDRLATHRADGLAFLQYTSGTTGMQKGVALSHRAVLDHVLARIGALGLNAGDVIVSWLPLYHDMGLIGGFLTPLIGGIPTVLMSPFHWVRDPWLLMRCLHEFRGTFCWMPNFAFNHCLRAARERERAGIDLSPVRGMFNGSEPVRLDTLQGFAQHFARYGLAPQALKTAYGMAEMVQTVALTPMDQAPRADFVKRSTLQSARRAVAVPPQQAGAMPVVSCGAPLPGTSIQIVDDARRPLPDRHVGEIAVKSPWMLTGYFHRPDLTHTALDQGWFFSGDLGYLADGQLYVCGRIKELIISAGKNVYPQDVEGIANTIRGVYAGRVAAFGIIDPSLGSERVHAVCETRPEVQAEDLIRIERELRRRVVQELDITLADVRLVQKGWVLKTSNGKIARAANRDKYLREFGAT